MRAKHLLLAAFTLALGAVACENNVETPATPNEEAKTYTIRLRANGDVDVTHNPLTRFTPDDRDLYAIEVRYKPASESRYSQYAYGLFDNLDNAVLELTENYNYNFTVLLIDDAKDKIYCDSILVDNVPYIGYSTPFKAYNKYHASDNSYSNTRVTNEFIIAEDKYFGNIGRSILYHLADGTTSYSPENIDVYYGERNGFTPEEGVTEIYINLERMNYGLKVEVSDFFDEGTLTVSYHSDRKRILTPDNKSFETVFAHSSPESWYNSSNAGTSYSLDFSWTKADGSVVNWDSINVSYHRLQQTVVTLNYYGEDEVAGMNSLVFTYEDTPIEEIYKEYTHGEDQGDYEW